MRDSFFKKIAIPSNISTYLSHSLIIITVATTLLTGGILILQQSFYFNKTNKQRSFEYVEDQKGYIQEIVKNELEYIRLQNDAFKKRINSKISQNVNQAIYTAETIYKRYEGIKSDEEIKSLIIATISSLKFEMEYEEVFISTLDGIGVYYPRKPEFTGKDMKQFKDANGSSVILKEIELLNNKNEGFLDYDFDNKSSDNASPHKKITFVKRFSHFNWYFGSKQYVDDYFPKFRNEIAQKISSVRFRNGGYVFLNQTDGTPIVMNGDIYKGSENLHSGFTTQQREVFRQQIQIARSNPEGGFFTYKWVKMNNSIPVEKCSFVKSFPEYDWVIGAGFYLDEINQSISNQQKALGKDQTKSILTILVILVFLLILEALIIYHFNKKYKSDFERFFNFFYQSQNSFNKINISEFYFDEFKRAGIAANKMIILREEIERKLIEEQKKATEADRLKSAFLANMSHEIRTPMNAILGFSELLEDNTQDEEDKLLFIQLIRKNGDMLLNLINDIIDISKIEANLLSIRKKPFRLDNFLIEVGNHYTETLTSQKNKDIRLWINNEVDIDEIILTDEIRLKQILDNLIGNAIKFTHSGSVWLDVKKQGDLIHFSVSDTGIGIPYDQQSSIFERFMQAEQNHKINFGGTGLGLAISKNLIELLGGKIHVESEPGKGSIFHFHIQAN